MATEGEKLDRIYNKLNEQGIMLAKFMVTQEHQQKQIDAQQNQINVLEAERNKAIGEKSIIGLIAGAIGAGIMAAIKFWQH